jgi:hypothetical protein
VNKPHLTMYGYWEVEFGAKLGHWMIYETPEEAVDRGGDGVMIYELTARKLGRFKKRIVLEETDEKPKARRR